MTDQQQTMVPTAEDFFQICAQMLAAAKILSDITTQQSDEIRHLIAAFKAQNQ